MTEQLPRGWARPLLQGGLLASASVLFALFIGDWTMGWLGYPSRIPLRVAHPPNYTEDREFIEFRYKFSTNAQGLRDKTRTLSKPPGIKRIVVLGDSFAEGFGVQSPDRFTDRLEGKADQAGERLAFINAGLTGTGPVQYGRLFEHVGLDYEPDGVIICLYANDVANTPDDPTEITHRNAVPTKRGLKRLLHGAWPHLYTLLETIKVHRTYLAQTQTTDYVGSLSRRATQMGIKPARIEQWRARLPTELVEAVNRNRFGRGPMSYGLIYPEFWSDSIDLDTAKGQARFANMMRAVDDTVKLARSKGVEVAIAYLPSMFQYDPSAHLTDNLWIRTGTRIRREWLTGVTPVEQALATWASQHGLPFLSLTNAFRDAIGNGGSMNFPLDSHWNENGHALAAESIWQWLREEHVFTFTHR